MARLLCDVRVIGLFAAIVLLAASADAATCYKHLPKDDYPNCIQLDSSLVLHWNTLDNNTLVLAPDADGSLSWLAIGISEAGMKGVDFNILIRATTGLSWIVGDYFTTDYSTPTLDLEQNTDLETFPDSDNDNNTLAVWARPLDSCDVEDVAVLLGVERSIVWAYDYTTTWDAAKMAFSNYTKGIRRGVKLFTNGTQPTADNATYTLSLAMPSYAVQPSNSSVACANLALPSDAAYHVVAYQGFNTTPFVTRVAGYVCGPGVVPTVPPNMTYTCGPLMLPAGCERLNFIWAPGATGFTAPPEAGFAIGAGAASTLVLQVYYRNPAGVVGMTDSSGLTLTYTPKLRNATLGVLTLGNTDMRIPNATDRYTALPNICPASCTAKRVLAPVTLVSSFYVLGRLGAATLTRHIRGGSAMQPVGRINYWDPKYLGFQSAFPESRTLLPNDTLISLCTYNSTQVPRLTTFYGINAWQELCFNYLTFYPLSAMPDLDYCIADTRKNISTCATRTAIAAAANATDSLQGGTKIPVGPLNISLYQSVQCELHDQTDVTPYHKPNTGAAVASVVLVPSVLIIIGAILWTKYTKQEELEALLAEARLEAMGVEVAE